MVNSGLSPFLIFFFFFASARTPVLLLWWNTYKIFLAAVFESDFFRHIRAGMSKVRSPHDSGNQPGSFSTLTKIFVQHTLWSSSNTYHNLSPTLTMLFLQYTLWFSSSNTQYYLPPPTYSTIFHLQHTVTFLQHTPQSSSSTHSTCPPAHTALFLQHIPQSLQFPTLTSLHSLTSIQYCDPPNVSQKK
jgi:hypothetical protein